MQICHNLQDEVFKNLIHESESRIGMELRLSIR